jgi:nitrite reductase/ring-hydroxylating ferredoxin subunit
MEYSHVANQTGLAESQTNIVEAGRNWNLLANVSGSYFAIANKCTHAGGLMANGALDDTCIRCPALGPCSICGPASRWNRRRSAS